MKKGEDKDLFSINGSKQLRGALKLLIWRNVLLMLLPKLCCFRIKKSIHCVFFVLILASSWLLQQDRFQLAHSFHPNDERNPLNESLLGQLAAGTLK